MLAAPIPAGYSVAVTDARSPASPMLSQVVTDPTRAGKRTLYWVADVPALGTVVYAVGLAATSRHVQSPPEEGAAPLTLTNGVISLSFDATGRLASWANASTGRAIPLVHEFLIYHEHLPGSNVRGGGTRSTVYFLFFITNTLSPNTTHLPGVRSLSGAPCTASSPSTAPHRSWWAPM